MFNVISLTESYQTKRINKYVVEMTFIIIWKNGSSLKWMHVYPVSRHMKWVSLSPQLKKHPWISDQTGVSLGLQLPCALPQYNLIRKA